MNSALDQDLKFAEWPLSIPGSRTAVGSMFRRCHGYGIESVVIGHVVSSKDYDGGEWCDKFEQLTSGDCSVH